ncbi:MAG: hypothetical protein JSV24_08350 [Bacteroidales bacterium]|nr:MAG: hypothetical protein JSV24_08350 [Bacteroidales bacterium]
MKCSFIVPVFFILVCFSCAPALPLIVEEGSDTPLITISVANPPDTISTEGLSIKLDYTWNSPRQVFEELQKAVGGIKYSVTNGKFGGGRHDYGWPVVLDRLEDSGSLNFFAVNKFGSGSEEGYASGNGRLMYGISCTYKDREGKKHRGAVSNYLEIPVVFVK